MIVVNKKKPQTNKKNNESKHSLKFKSNTGFVNQKKTKRK